MERYPNDPYVYYAHLGAYFIDEYVHFPSHQIIIINFVSH